MRGERTYDVAFEVAARKRRVWRLGTSSNSLAFGAESKLTGFITIIVISFLF